LRAAERVGEQGYLKILLIAVVMVLGMKSGAYLAMARYLTTVDCYELPATTTRTDRKTCAHQRAAETVEEPGYQKNLGIAVAMVALRMKSGGYLVLSRTYRATGS
jgi:hypothetical protein